MSDRDEPLDEHIPWLRRLTRSLVLDQSRADDVLQQVFLVALRKKPSRDRDLKPWLASVARKVAFNQRRAEARRLKRETGASQEKIVTVEIVHSVPSQTEIGQILNQFVGELSEPYRTSLILHFTEGLSVAEVAQRMKVPKPTAQTRIRRGLQQLRAKMDKRFGNRETWCLLLLPVLQPADAIPKTGTGGSIALGSSPWVAKIHALFAGKVASVAAVLAIAAVPATVAIVGLGSGTSASTEIPDGAVSRNSPALEYSAEEAVADGLENSSAQEPASLSEDESLEEEAEMEKRGREGRGGGALREKEFVYHKNGKLTERQNKKGNPPKGSKKKH